jgi:plasmid stabilization system protein ParE
MGHQKKTAATTYEVRISTNALQNIDEITGYIAFVNQQPLNAVKVGDALYGALDNRASEEIYSRRDPV